VQDHVERQLVGPGDGTEGRDDEVVALDAPDLEVVDGPAPTGWERADVVELLGRGEDAGGGMAVPGTGAAG
jgi:hypothetical protein